MELKLKVRKFWGLNLTFVEVTGEKYKGGGRLFALPILNRVKAKQPEPIINLSQQQQWQHQKYHHHHHHHHHHQQHHHHHHQQHQKHQQKQSQNNNLRSNLKKVRASTNTSSLFGLHTKNDLSDNSNV